MTEEQKEQLKKEFSELTQNNTNQKLSFSLNQIKETVNGHIIRRESISENGIHIGIVHSLANGKYSDVPVQVAKDSNGQINTLWGRKPHNSGIKVGDKVAYLAWGAFNMIENQDTYDLIDDEYIIAILK